MQRHLARQNQRADRVPLADAPEPRAAVVPEVLREPFDGTAAERGFGSSTQANAGCTAHFTGAKS